MIVLGYLSSTQGNSVLIPPFHTGHLGLIPETQVNLYFMAPPDSGGSNCEVLVTPIKRKPDSLMQITCVMNDKPGVVSHLIDAVSQLGINILSEESSAINHLNHHFVNLLVDWSGTNYSDDSIESLPSVQRRYRDYANSFPITSMRCVTLFESIMAHCGDVITWDLRNKTAQPRLSFRPLRIPREEQSFGDTVIKKSGPNYSVKFDLPENLSATIRQRVKPRSAEHNIRYLLLSDTEDRTLRVFFPKPDVRQAIVHVGFKHNDVPGALAAITSMVANAKFNILTSLLRKKTSAKNVWEAVLEYRGQHKTPQISADEPMETQQLKGVKWTAEILAETAPKYNTHQIRDFDIVIAPPDYPAVKESVEVQYESLLKPETIKNAEEKRSIDLLIQDRLDEVKKTKDLSTIFREEVLQAVKDNVRQQPRVFLSYTKRAAEHGALLKSRLEATSDFRPHEYQLARGEVIVENILRKIESCDYFVGIWHHEDGLDRSVVSPWLPFEYGIALAFGRKCIIVHSNKLDETIWKRISPEVAHAEYSDIKFQMETIPLIIENLTKFERDRH